MSAPGQPPSSDDPDRDLGLGSRVAQQSRARFLNRDGSFNVERRGLPFWRSLSLYHSLLTIPWPAFFLVVAGGYVLTNLVFAAAYVAAGRGALEGASAVGVPDRFLEAFFFSVHTLATIGYGSISPRSMTAQVLVAVEALIGLLGFALATGLLFARFSRPTAQIVFSDKAVVAPYRGATGLMFRILNERRSQMIEVDVTVSLGRLEEVGGRPQRRFHELALERRRVVFFPLHWVIVHPIDEQSPLRGVTPEQFAASDAEIVVLVTGIDETFAQTVHARSSYKHEEVVWGARFRDMFVPAEDGRPAIDARRLHDIDPA